MKLTADEEVRMWPTLRRAAALAAVTVSWLAAACDAPPPRALADAFDWDEEMARAWGDDPLPADTSTALRVCADPNNLPFSNRAEEGFENALARLVADEMGRRVRYTWRPQRRGFIRTTLRSRRCDVVMGVPSSFELAATTAPYYRSTYVFLYRADAGFRIATLDDDVLRDLRIGVHVVGDDYASTPGAEALGRRGLVENLVGYSIFGDYGDAAPPSDLVDAVAEGQIDVAVAWGPLAGYFAERHPVDLEVVPVSPQIEPPFTLFVYDISMAVRRDDQTLLEELEGILERRRPEIRELLEDYGVPLVQSGGGQASGTAPDAGGGGSAGR